MNKVILLSVFFIFFGCVKKSPETLSIGELPDELANLSPEELHIAIETLENRVRLLEYILNYTEEIQTEKSKEVVEDTEVKSELLRDLDLLLYFNKSLLDTELSESEDQRENCEIFIETQNDLSEDLKKTLNKRARNQYNQDNKRARIEIEKSFFKISSEFVFSGMEGGAVIPVSGIETCNIEDRQKWATIYTNINNNLALYTENTYGGDAVLDNAFLTRLEGGKSIKKRNDRLRFAGILLFDIGVSVVLWKYGVAKLAHSLTKGSMNPARINNLMKGGTFVAVGLTSYYLDNLLFLNPDEPEEVSSQWNGMIAQINHLVDLNANSPDEYSHFFWNTHKLLFEGIYYQIISSKDVLLDQEKEWGSMANSLVEHKKWLEELKKVGV